MSQNVEKQNCLKYYVSQARRAGISSAGAVRPRTAIDKTSKARRVNTSLRFKNAYEYHSATTVSRCLQESLALVGVESDVRHASHSFEDEYLHLLKKHEVEYDPRYVWD